MRINPTIQINNQSRLNLSDNRASQIGYMNKPYGSSPSFGSRKSDAALVLLIKSMDSLTSNGNLGFLEKIKLHKVMKDALPSIMIPKNYLNCGVDSKVYRINDKYVAKIARGHYQNNSVRFYNTVSLPNKKYSGLDCYCGEAIAKLGHVEILKNATPSNDSVFCGIQIDRLLTTKLKKSYENEYIPVCSRVPQESFDDLANDLKKMNAMKRFCLSGKKYYTPDVINPNNIIISNNKFKIVDKLDNVYDENPNTVYTMIEPLLIKLTPDTPTEYNEDIYGMRKDILRKCLISCEKAELPLKSPLKWEYTDHTLQSILPDCDIISDLEVMRSKNAPIRSRIDFINRKLADRSQTNM